MNERIRELWKATAVRDDTTHSWTYDFDMHVNRFAELIIRECANSCGSQVDKVSILKAFDLPVESNIKYSATPPKWSKESQYKREYNIVRETK